ncbi:DNA-binding NarL/FixJ family response regulator [Paraburkholderia sp. Clong3]|uniref:Two component transcriptional regulator, LuxR family n=1 Tax=Paraburkholderia tuberum TaxID=157910 RepID=A0A1H1G006_9BURK|nr:MULTISPECIES: response regulator transcription factor [Paraburkholderia]MBB5407846.1 DNA-binding NarL/FixJ family response regulator [Paraburkholderia sp. HC6.4b]MBB5453438.1 DNA-binding NarL/FixJ family response regulator [Paraburkholderia sp. Kb1A]MBB5459344.1 DNA-binding NarL/FixJ family response regulator [Paraburkholderia sp. Cpub6]MBC8721594.1 response regulator transcription factor [Paraburkholderia sp. 31.1]MBC8730816.1 response regulator transcription factor [Paraburkholderia sp. U
MRFAILNSNAERRDGLKALLRQIDRLARFTEADEWRLLERPFKRYRPDLVVIDWEDWMSVAQVRALLSHFPDLRISVLTDGTLPALVRALMDEGVLGVVPRDTDPCLIVRALEMVLLGGHYVPPGALAIDPPLPTDTAIRTFDEESPPPRRNKLSGGLSPRQEQIMRCVHMGSTNKMIARTLGISEGTVKIHLTSIFQQLGAPNRAAAVALYNGWLTNHLQVLRNNGEHSARPVIRGQPGPVPLRRRTRARFQYPLPGSDTSSALPMAAEPATSYGEAPPGRPARKSVGPGSA